MLLSLHVKLVVSIRFRVRLVTRPLKLVVVVERLLELVGHLVPLGRRLAQLGQFVELCHEFALGDGERQLVVELLEVVYHGRDTVIRSLNRIGHHLLLRHGNGHHGRLEVRRHHRTAEDGSWRVNVLPLWLA